ncbi:MAG: hypothetical protein O2782_17570 [bacterium]|nr:hypothetical protein [bacterium]
MSRIAYVTNEPIHIAQLIDTGALRRGATALIATLRKMVHGVVKFAAMWYL